MLPRQTRVEMRQQWAYHKFVVSYCHARRKRHSRIWFQTDLRVSCRGAESCLENYPKSNPGPGYYVEPKFGQRYARQKGISGSAPSDRFEVTVIITAASDRIRGLFSVFRVLN